MQFFPQAVFFLEIPAVWRMKTATLFVNRERRLCIYNVNLCGDIKGMPAAHYSSPLRGGKRRAFSLVELLAVVALIIVMVAMLAPTIGGFTSTYGRRAAVNGLMNAFEQARVTALESGAETFVIMRSAPYPQQDAFIVMRRRGDLDGPSTNPAALIQMSRWQQLPRGVLFPKFANTISTDGALQDATFSSSLPGTPPLNELFAVGFNARGQISFPPPNQGDLHLYLGEYVRESADGSTVGKGASAVGNITERLVFARYTGRVFADVKTQPGS